MRKKSLFLLLLGGITWLMAGGILHAATEPETESVTAEESETVSGTEIRAQDDFYGYVNFETLMNMEIPFGQSSNGTLMQAGDKVEEQLNQIIEQVVNSGENYEPGSNEQLIRDIYQQSLEYDYETSGAKEHLGKLVDRIEGADSLEALVPILGELYTDYGCNVLFRPTVMSNVYEPDENALFAMNFTSVCGQSLEKVYEEEEIRVKLKNTIREALYEFGISYDEAERRGKELTYLILEVAGDSDFSINHMVNPYSKLTRVTEAEMEEIFQSAGSGLLTASYGIDENPYGEWYTPDLEQLKSMGRILSEDNLEQLKSYAVAELFCSYQICLSDDMQKYESDEQKGAECVRYYMEEQLGELYAREYLTEELMTGVTDLCRDIQDACAEKIDSGEWMSEETRALLKKKLYNIEFQIGAPEEHVVDEKDQELIGDNLFETIVNLNTKKTWDNLAQIGEPYDRSQFGMSPLEINACYDHANVMTIPLAMMQEPVYSLDADYAENLGKLGMVVAHELSHAFDSSCIFFDENGKYDPSWISEEDYNKFTERSGKVVEYYDQFTVLDVYYVDGELTLGENYADLAAMETLVTLVQTKEEYQILFESYAQLWCELEVDTSAVEMLVQDVHSPSKTRVNAVLSSCEEFCETYDVQPEDGMYQENRVSRW